MVKQLCTREKGKAAASQVKKKICKICFYLLLLALTVSILVDMFQEQGTVLISSLFHSNWLALGAAPVSYTHLDVYKRQGAYRVDQIDTKGIGPHPSQRLSQFGAAVYQLAADP